mgnify:CR=1 FL=1|tara:strand:- start:2955 stop:3647 length:693 start_codon:yes stop_codon:yes gene_type:complete
MDTKNAFMEVESCVKDFEGFEQNSQKLIEAMMMSSVRGFGWSVGLVIDTPEFSPKLTEDGIETIIKTDESLDHWTLNYRGDLFIMQTLFEDRRDKSSIYLDTRLVRTLETFARIGALYRYMGLNNNKVISVKLAYKGLLNRKLSIANTGQFMPPLSPRVSSVGSFTKHLEYTLEQLTSLKSLKEITYSYCNEFLRVFNEYNLPKDVAETAMNEHSVIKGVEQVFRVSPRP